MDREKANGVGGAVPNQACHIHGIMFFVLEPDINLEDVIGTDPQFDQAIIVVWPDYFDEFDELD